MKLDKSFLALGEQVQQKYPVLHKGRIDGEIQRMQYLVANTRELVGRRIMDLGCGSEKNTDRTWNPITRLIQKYKDPYEYARFQPWYCRILQDTGASAVGVDIASNKKETFESHEIDLLNPDALDRFDDESFDDANNYFLSVPKESMHARQGTSPNILLSLAWKNRKIDVHAAREEGLPYHQWSPFFLERNMERMWAINDQIFAQVQRVLKRVDDIHLQNLCTARKKAR